MRSRLVSLALAIACALVAALPAAAAAPGVGPKGDAFYKPPSKLPGKKHGDLIWSRTLPSKFSVKAASEDRLVLYRSTDFGGNPTAVSGFVLVPKGKPPKGGFPIVTFGHGTTGNADQCAPSKGRIGTGYIAPLWNGYLKQGYAVAQTDYEGLGTPGDHPYLFGPSEGRGVLDITRAARQVDPRIGTRVLFAGHSQGGHAILWAAGLAKSWTPELKVLGSQAFAPIANASILAGNAEAFTTPGGLAPYSGLITNAFDTALADFEPSDFITQEGLDLLPDVDKRCLDGLFKTDSFGGISVADMIRDDIDKDLFVGLFKKYVDVNKLKLPGGVLLLHGTADTTIPISLSDQLEKDLKAAGTEVTYNKYEGATHSTVVDKGTKAALADAKQRLK